MVILFNKYLKSTRSTIWADRDTFKWSFNLSDNFGRIALWCLRKSELDCNVAYQSGVKQQAKNELWILSTDNEKTTDLADGLFMLPFENIEKMYDGTPYEHVCMECDAEIILITGKLDKHNIIKIKMRGNTLPPTARQTMTGGKPTSEEFTMKQTKELYCRETTKEAGVSWWESHVDHKKKQVPRWKRDGFLQLVVKKSLIERILDAEHYPAVTVHLGERRLYHTI